MAISVFSIVPITVGAVSYRENIIDAILKHENDWTDNWYYSGYYGDGTLEFLDLNFDGNLEFVVTYPCGSMGNISRNIYYFSGGQLCKAGGGDKSNLVSGYSGIKLTGYYDKNTSKYKLLGSSFMSDSVSDWKKCNYSLSFDGKDVKINYYSAETMSSNYGKINPPLHKYYNGAYSFENLGNANEIFESEYNKINNKMLENCIDINLSSKTVKSSDWKRYSTNEKRKALEESYDSFKYDKYNNFLGDVNGDRIVNAKDRMILTRYLAKWTGYENIDMTSADVNNDGQVNAKDRMILTRHLAKWKDYENLPHTH